MRIRDRKRVREIALSKHHSDTVIPLFMMRVSMGEIIKEFKGLIRQKFSFE